MNKNTIGKFIAELRREAGLTQRELAEKLSVSHKTVSRWECDETLPDLSLIPVIAEIFGVTADELLRGERKNNDAYLSNEAVTKPMPEKHEAESAPKPKKESASLSQRGEKELSRMLTVAKTKHLLRVINSAAIAVVGVIVSVTFSFAFRSFRGEAAVLTALGFALAAIFYAVTGTVNTMLSLNAEDIDNKSMKERVNGERRIVVKRLMWCVSAVVMIFVLSVVWFHLWDFVEFIFCSLIFAPITALGCCIIAVIVWDRLKRNGTVE